jgi:hypothetical protein
MAANHIVLRDLKSPILGQWRLWGFHHEGFTCRYSEKFVLKLWHLMVCWQLPPPRVKAPPCELKAPPPVAASFDMTAGRSLTVSRIGWVAVSSTVNSLKFSTYLMYWNWNVTNAWCGSGPTGHATKCPVIHIYEMFSCALPDIRI